MERPQNIVLLEMTQKKLRHIFLGKTPNLPANWKRFIVKCFPWLSLAAGIASFYAVWHLWHQAHYVYVYPSYVRGGFIAKTSSPHITFWKWLTILILCIEGVLYLSAFRSLRSRLQRGWQTIYYVMLMNIIYCIVVLFSSFRGFGSFIFEAIFTIIGLYVLFQISSAYNTHIKDSQLYSKS